MNTKAKIQRSIQSTMNRVLAIVVVVASLCAYQLAHSQSGSSGRFAINLKDADIHSLIEAVSEQTGRNFIIDPRVKAKVTVIFSEQTSADKLYEIFLSVLEVHGFAAVPAGEMIKIVPTSVGVQSPVPVVMEPQIPNDELVTEVVPIKNTPAQQMAEALRPLAPETATIIAEPNSNTLVVTDRSANIEKLLETIRLLDRRN